MTTVTVWLLISLGTYGRGPIYTIERFSTPTECMRVLNNLFENSGKTTRLRCVQASTLPQHVEIVK